MFRFTKHLWMIVLALTALVVLMAPATQAASPLRAVQMDEPFEINGQIIGVEMRQREPNSSTAELLRAPH